MCLCMCVCMCVSCVCLSVCVVYFVLCMHCVCCTSMFVRGVCVYVCVLSCSANWEVTKGYFTSRWASLTSLSLHAASVFASFLLRSYRAMHHSCSKLACWMRSRETTSRSSAISAWNTSRRRSGLRPLKWVLWPALPWRNEHHLRRSRKHCGAWPGSLLLAKVFPWCRPEIRRRDSGLVRKKRAIWVSLNLLWPYFKPEITSGCLSNCVFH